jgi:Na+-translocating ferredoxin:NAD+ oxidoreductase subunit G
MNATAPRPPSAARLLGTLAVAGALAGLLIVTVFEWAQPRILENRERALASAVDEVLAGPAAVRTLWLHGGALVDELPAGADAARTERFFLGFDDAGRPVGFAIRTGRPGFQDVIELIFGYDAANRRVIGMKVLDSKETPGLGDKIEKDERFVGAFRSVLAPIRGVKPGSGRGGEDEIDLITGATISARTVIEAINAAVEKHQAVLDEYLRGGTP